MFADWFTKLAFRNMRKAATRKGLHCERLEDRTAPSATRTVSPTEVIVRFTGPDGLATLHAHPELIGLDLAASASLGGNLVKVALNGTTPDAAIATLEHLPGVAWAAPNYRYSDVPFEAFPVDAPPNDHLFSTQTAAYKAARIYDSGSSKNAWTYINSIGAPPRK